MSGGETLPGIRYCEVSTTYGGIPQRWVVVFSQSARDREKKTLDRAIQRESRSLSEALSVLQDTASPAMRKPRQPGTRSSGRSGITVPNPVW